MQDFLGQRTIFARYPLPKSLVSGKEVGNMEYLSKERYDEIVAEINFLINEEYPRIKDALAEARAQGDLSENFE